LLYRFADMLAVQTPSVAEKMPSFYPGVASIRSISNPLPEQVARDMSRTNSPRKSLLSLGRLSSEKQVHRIIEAFSRTACEFEDWDLNIYGDGPEKSALIQIVKDLGLQQRVFICGQTRSPWDIMAGSSAFVMTSQYEGFPNSLLEAMGVGLPCITFDCPSGPREISENGEAALLVPLNDQNALVSAMRLIMRDDAFRISLGHKARSSVLTRFSLGAVLAQWDELFVEVGAS
jgi:glycosyltransferase involved in cell wall biosynthesis